MWDLSCMDWESRIRSGRSLIPDLPLIEEEAALGLQIFDELQLPDVAGQPKLRDAVGQWFRDIVRVAFGSWDPALGERMINDIFLLAPKGQSKTSYSAGLILTAMLMNQEPRAQMLFVGPTQAISDRAYGQVEGMIELSPELSRRFHLISHQKRIEDRVNRSEMAVKTFDLSILTGSIPSLVLLDEIHLLGRNAHTAKVLRQIRGGLEKRRNGLLLITTTQSDERPAGAFRDELIQARKIRDGRFRGQNIRSLLPILYEFPEDIAKDPVKWQDAASWPMVMPNLGRSVQLNSLARDWESERTKGAHAIQVWASQHLNIEIGLGLKTDQWPGVDFWARRADPALTFEALLDRCEVVVVGIDGGGLDDLFGFAALGRERGTKHWLLWSHGWCHRGVLDRRQTIAQKLLDFEKAGELTIVADELNDISAIVEIVSTIKDRGLLGCVAVDPAGLGAFVDAMAEIEVTQENDLLVGVGQGYRMMNAIKTTERRLANGTFWHNGSSLMTWCVENLKIEPTATAIRATKQNAGDAKIDPAMAAFDAADIMTTNPDAKGKSGWNTDDIDALMAKIDAAAAAL
ncbi:MAG: terminase large subunit [Devosia sp.]|nr:terminase large subunit [Devosia sp.]